MNDIGILATPLGYILWAFYLLFNNFGWAIILFTLVIKLITLPFTIKQQKNTAQSAIFAPKVKEIQQKYRNNKEKMNEEMVKLQKQGYNPMGGCAPLLITMLVLFGVIEVVYKPMTHMERLSTQDIKNVVEQAYQVEVAKNFINPEYDAQRKMLVEWYNNEKGADALKEPELVRTEVTEENNAGEDTTIIVTVDQVKYYNAVYRAVQAELESDKDNKDKIWTKLSEKPEGAADTTETENNLKKANQFKTNLTSQIEAHYGAYVKGEFVLKGQQGELRALSLYNTNKDAFDDSVKTTAIGEKMDSLNSSMNFLGLPLGQTPKLELSWLILIPIFSFLFSMAQMVLSNRINKKTNPAMAEMNGSMKIMLYMMPLFSLFIAFSVPAGVGFYWIVSYAFGMVQTVWLSKVYSPEKMRALAEEKFKNVIVDNKVETTAKVADPKYLDKNGKPLSQKEIDKIKLAEARRLDAEKYGEDYTDEE